MGHGGLPQVRRVKVRERRVPLSPNVPTPFTNKLDGERLDELLGKEGVVSQRQRASHLMKLLYRCRTAWPPTAVVISRLASLSPSGTRNATVAWKG